MIRSSRHISHGHIPQRHIAHRTAWRGRLVPITAAAALLVALGACGSDTTTATVAPTSNPATTVAASSTPAPTSAPAATPAPLPSGTAATEAPATPVTTAPATTAPSGSSPANAAQSAPTSNAITISTPGMSYVVSGPLRPGVASITLRNDDDEAHMMSVARLKPGVTLDQVKAALAKSEDAAGALLADGQDKSVYGTPAPVGAGQSTTVTAEHLQAGDYVLVCFFNDNTGTPHFKMGMVGELTVTGDEATDTPHSDGTIAVDDSAITLPDGFTGQGTFLVSNTGNAPHSISFARLDPGTTLDAFYQHAGEAMNSGKAIDGGGGVLDGGVDSLLPGQSAYVTLDLPSGHYGYLSMDDAQGPTIPAQHGEFDVA